MARKKPTKFYIGADQWPGLSKVMEEAAEVVQVASKIIGTDGVVSPWGDADLRVKLTEELGDLLAAITFLAEREKLNIIDRAGLKLAQYNNWHTYQTAKDLSTKKI